MSIKVKSQIEKSLRLVLLVFYPYGIRPLAPRYAQNTYLNIECLYIELRSHIQVNLVDIAASYTIVVQKCLI